MANIIGTYWHSHLETSCWQAASQFESLHLAAVNQCRKESVWRYAFSISSKITKAQLKPISKPRTGQRSHRQVHQCKLSVSIANEIPTAHSYQWGKYRKVWNFNCKQNLNGTQLKLASTGTSFARSWKHIARLRFVIDTKEETKRMVSYDNHKQLQETTRLLDEVPDDLLDEVSKIHLDIQWAPTMDMIWIWWPHPTLAGHCQLLFNLRGILKTHTHTPS